MDLVMPGMDGAAATQAIRENCPETQVIALTSFKEEDLVQRSATEQARSAICSRMFLPTNWSTPSGLHTPAGPPWRRKPRTC